MSETDAAAVAVASGAECAPALPEDVISEILARVPDVAFLFRCAVVCKRWRRVVADPAFLRRLLPEDGRPSLLGFFVQHDQPSVTARRFFPNRALAFVPAPGSALAPRRLFLTSFVHDDTGLLDKANPMAARDGLLLLRVPRAAGRRVLRLCVCNLLTGKVDVLPPLDAACFDGEGVRGCAVLTAADHGAGPHRPADVYSTFFQVLLVGVHHGDKQVYIHRFSSAATASRNWSATAAPTNCFREILEPFAVADDSRVAAVFCGTAHWLFRGHGSNGPISYTLDVSVSTGHVCATKLLVEALPPFIRDVWSNTWLCLSTDARLSLVHLQDDHLVIWTRKDGDQGGTVVWPLTRVIAVDVEVETPSFGMMALATISVGEKSGTALVLYPSEPDDAHVLDLQSGLTTKVVGWKRSFNYMTAVPYEINWPEFFMSRLGVRR